MKKDITNSVNKEKNEDRLENVINDECIDKDLKEKQEDSFDETLEGDFIDDFNHDELIEEYQRDQDAYAVYAEDIQGLVEHLGPVIDALRHRLQVYCEQNRVTLNGEILDETAEGEHLGDNDATDWFEKVRVFNQWKHHLNVSGGPLTDEERESFREMKEEAGRQENLQNRQDVQPWQRTREEATSTNSDLQEQASRQELRRLNRRLYEAGLKDVAKIVQEYVVGTRYVVG